MNQHVGTLTAERPLDRFFTRIDMETDISRAIAATDVARQEEAETEAAFALVAAALKRRTVALKGWATRRAEQARSYTRVCDCSPSNRFGHY